MEVNRHEEIKVTLLQGIADLFSFERQNFENEKPYSICEIKEGYHKYLKIVCKNDKVQYFLQDFAWERKPDLMLELKGINDIEKIEFIQIWSDILSEIEVFFLNPDNEPMFAYKLRLVIEFESLKDNSRFEEFFDFEDKKRKEQLKEKMQEYIQEVVYTAKRQIKDEREMIVFCDNIFNFELMEYDELQLIEILEKSFHNMKFFKNQKLERYFYSNVLNMLKKWTEKDFFPLYCEEIGRFSRKYKLKKDIKMEDIDYKKLELYVYQSICKIRYSGYNLDKTLGRKDLEIAKKEFGSKKAEQYLEQGSGIFDKSMINFEDEDVVCRANDIFSTISINILKENEQAYSKALDFITNLLSSGFPHSYHINLTSQAPKRFLSVKGLAKTQTHRFFAQALEYESLYKKLELYVKTAMQKYAWYEDIEESDKMCMPGSYAVFGLSLKKEEYFPLLIQYFSTLDSENQTVHQYFLNSFIDENNVNEKNISVLCEGLLSARFNIKFENVVKIMENKENKELLIKELEHKNKDQQEDILYGIWGKDWRKHVSGF